MINFHIITLFPNLIESYFNDSMLKRAQEEGSIGVHLYDPRKHATDKHTTVDDKPYGGGPGMVMKVEPLIKTWEVIKGRKRNIKTILFTPGGVQLTNDYAREVVSTYNHVILIAGRYEGVDARVKEITSAEEVSIGPYILTGGEIPAALFVDVASRQIPGVLGNSESLEENRIAGSVMYTRPETFIYKKQRYDVPGILLSGDHKKIEAWKQERYEDHTKKKSLDA